MPHCWNGRQARFRLQYSNVCRFESYMGYMEKFILRHKRFILRVTTTENNTNILNSYRVKNIEDMIDILYKIQDKSKPEMAVNKRSIWGMLNEWRTHNLLYSLGIEKDRTKSVGLDYKQPWYMSVAYALISPFYFHFM